MKKKTIFKFTTICFILIGKVIYAQEIKTVIPPLYQYLQNNADSTIVLTYNKNPIYPTLHFILSKNSNVITLYLYDSPYDRRGEDILPKNIRNFFQKRDIEINRLKVDTNPYFNTKYIEQKKALDLWSKTMSFCPWQLTDDTTEGEGCKILGKLNNPSIYDGRSVRLYLITNNEIKPLNFYAPDFYDVNCPRRKSRTTILELERLFKRYFEKRE